MILRDSRDTSINPLRLCIIQIVLQLVENIPGILNIINIIEQVYYPLVYNDKFYKCSYKINLISALNVEFKICRLIYR